MKNIIKSFISAYIITLLMFTCCNLIDNHMSRHYGGTMTINVKKGYKVTNASWKVGEDKSYSVWYFTEPMDSDYIPKTKELVEHSELGVLEGKVKFIESK